MANNKFNRGGVCLFKQQSQKDRKPLKGGLETFQGDSFRDDVKKLTEQLKNLTEEIKKLTEES